MPPTRSRRLALLAAVPLLISTSWVGASHECKATGDRPFVCDVEGELVAGGRSRPFSPAQGLALEPGAELVLRFTAFDQYGRRFPPERLVLRMDVDRRCDDIVKVEQHQGQFEIAAGGKRGTCELVLWVPGNLNAEWPIRVEVVGLALDRLSHPQAEKLGRLLYRAILGREADPGGLASATDRIYRGEIEKVVRVFFESPEFAERRARISDWELLDGFYRGLFRRGVDASAERTYLREIERGRLTGLVMTLLASDEVLSQLLEK